MFQMKWNLTLDSKLRIQFPAELSISGSEKYYMKIGKEDCIVIVSEKNHLLENDPDVWLEACRDRKRDRITIRAELRSSVSLYCAPKVTLVLKQGYYVIWPGWVPVV